MASQESIHPKQQIYREIVVGTLIYSVVFGFFNDYTDLLSTNSYSTTFLVALAMQLMIWPTFQFKKWIVTWFKDRPGKTNKVAMGLSVWAVMFFSKFLFLEVLALLFGEYLYVQNFVVLILVIACATILGALNDRIFDRLGQSSSPQA